MKRIFLFLITNLAVMLVLGTVAQLLGSPGAYAWGGRGGGGKEEGHGGG